MNADIGNGRSGALGRPRKISKERILETALAVLLDTGLASFSMPKLAKHMNVGVMTLYHYFPSKTDLLDAVAENLFARFEMPEADLPWEPAIRGWVRAVCKFFSDYPAALKLINWDDHISLAWLSVSLPMLRILAKEGPDEAELAFAAHWVVNVVMGIIASRHMSAEAPDLPLLQGTSAAAVADNLLIARINRHYRHVSETRLIEFVADNIIDGLRKLVSL
jgi:AcrR family transcriptional regulator